MPYLTFKLGFETATAAYLVAESIQRFINARRTIRLAH